MRLKWLMRNDGLRESLRPRYKTALLSNAWPEARQAPVRAP